MRCIVCFYLIKICCVYVDSNKVINIVVYYVLIIDFGG